MLPPGPSPHWIQRASVTGPDDQRVPWSGDIWLPHPGLTGVRHELELIAAHCAERGGLDRDWLFRLADGPPVLFFLAVLAFGHGQDAAGPGHAAGCLASTPDLANRVGDIVAKSRLGFATAWKSFGSATGSIEGIKSDFGTRLAYFAGFTRTEPRVLILDDDVLAALSAWGVSTAGPYLAFYKSYLIEAQDLADEGGFGPRPDVIEHALAERGRRLGSLEGVNSDRAAAGLPPLP